LALLGSLVVGFVVHFVSSADWSPASDGDNLHFYDHQIEKFDYELEVAAEREGLDKAEIDAVFGNVLAVTWGGSFGDGYRIIAYVPAPVGRNPCHTYEMAPFGGASAEKREVPEECAT
jgi:hypothetical protein